VAAVEHSTRAHALLSASGAKRWLACTPSPRLEEKRKDESSSYAREGTLAHEFADVRLRAFIGEITAEQADTQLETLRSNELYTREMERQVAKYVDYVLEALADAKAADANAVLRVEERVDFSKWVPSGFGTGDATIAARNTLHIADLKYGKGIQVDAEENPQLMLYGLGSLRAALEEGLNIQWVRLAIVQPRLDHISEWEIRAKDLLTWAEKIVAPTAAKAYAGEGKTVAGDHCRFCKVKGNCRAYHKLNTDLAKIVFKEPDLMSNEELVEVYEALPRIKKAAEVAAAYLKAEMLAGRKVPGYKVVEGRSNRRWGDEAAVRENLALLGYEEEEYLNVKLKGLGDLGDLMSEDEFVDLLGHLIVKPQGAPTIAKESSRKPVYISAQAAANVFKD